MPKQSIVKVPADNTSINWQLLQGFERNSQPILLSPHTKKVYIIIGGLCQSLIRNLAFPKIVRNNPRLIFTL